jgi:hypothetical protein
LTETTAKMSIWYSDLISAARKVPAGVVIR